MSIFTETVTMMSQFDVTCTHTSIFSINTKKLQGKTYLAEIGIQVANTVAEFFYVLREKLIGVGNPVVEVAHLVVSKRSQIFLVQVIA